MFCNIVYFSCFDRKNIFTSRQTEPPRFFFLGHYSQAYTKADNSKRPLTPAPYKTSDIIISLINRAILAGW